jgi:hypothetical protein
MFSEGLYVLRVPTMQAAGFRNSRRIYRHVNGLAMKEALNAVAHRAAPLKTPTRLTEEATRDIAAL